MSPTIKAALPLATLILALGACHSDSDPAPGGVTAGETKQLDQAAQDTDINAGAASANATQDGQ